MWKSKQSSFVTCTVSLALSLVSSQAFNFLDDFEGVTLNSFWTATSTAGGAVSVPCVTLAHAGGQSVRFTLSGGANNQAFLRHDFEELFYGTVSVWVFDPGPGGGANYFGLYLGSPTNALNLLANMWDSGVYYYQVYTKSYPTSVVRTRAWHHLVIVSTSTTLTLSIDEVLVYNGSGGIPFNSVRIGTYGTAAEASLAFDDFSISVVPITAPRLTIQFSQVEICWESLTNKSYQVQYSSDMTSNAWVNLGDPVAGNGSTNWIFDGLTFPRRYYRVVSSP